MLQNMQKKKKIETLSVLGFDGGELKNLSDGYILVKSKNYDNSRNSFVYHPVLLRQ